MEFGLRRRLVTKDKMVTYRDVSSGLEPFQRRDQEIGLNLTAYQKAHGFRQTPGNRSRADQCADTSENVARLPAIDGSKPIGERRRHDTTARKSQHDNRHEPPKKEEQPDGTKG